MYLNETSQHLRNLLLGVALSGVFVATPAFAAPTVADFDTAGTPYTLREWNSPGDDPPVIQTDAAHAEIGDYLQLIPETGSERNTIAFDRTAIGLYQTITVAYDFRITNTTGGPADGLGMSLLNTANYGTTGDGANFAQHSAPADSLNLGLDDYNNSYGPTEINNNHVEIAYDGQPDLAVTNLSSFSIHSGDWHHAVATFEYVTGGTAVSLVITPDAYGTPGAPVTVFDGAMIAGALPYEARVAFGAGTGGSDAAHDIDNLQADFALNGHGFNYNPDFSAANASDFTFNHSGDSTPTGFVTSGSDTILQLTAADNDERGSAWLNQKQTVANGFVSEFSFEFPTTNNGADGMGFVIQNIGTGLNTTETGPDNNALVIEFDSHDNGLPNDPSAAHVSIWANDTSPNLLATYDLAPDGDYSFTDLSNTGVHDVRVEYLNGGLTIYMDGKAIFTDVAVDLAALGAMDANGQSWLGFTSRTGGLNEEHNILSWSFVSAVPEPTTFAMLALGGLCLLRRRRNA